MPNGRHVTDADEVEQRLVTPFPLSLTRRTIYIGWRQRRAVIAGLVPSINQEWVAGSFASSKRDPGDIDVVTFLERSDILALGVAERQQLAESVGGLTSRLRYGTDGYLCPATAPGDPYHDVYLRARGYWDDFWSKDRAGIERGYLDVRGDP
jgi:hypothetical protein